MKRHIDLNVHSNAARKEGVITPEEIVAFARKDGAAAVAITDLNTVENVSELHRALQKSGADCKGIYGIRLHCLGQEDAPFLITALARNEDGLHDLFRLISAGCRQVLTESAWPCVSMEDVQQYRANLLIGRECPWSLIYRTAREREEALQRALSERFLEFDYVELRPWSQNPFRAAQCQLVSEDELKAAARRVVSCLLRMGKRPVAVSNGNCITDDDALCYRLLHEDAEGMFMLKSTEEVLEDFAFLGNLAETVVLDDPEELAAQIEAFSPIAATHIPVLLPDAEQRVRQLCASAAEERYGAPLPALVAERLSDELEKLTNCAATDPACWSYLLLLHLLTKKCAELGYLHNTRGWIGSSFLAYLLGITETNPLPPHRYCPRCRRVDRLAVDEYPSGFDAFAHERVFCDCGAEMRGDGHGLPCEFFFGWDGELELYCEPDVPREAIPALYAQLDELFGKEQVFSCGFGKQLCGEAEYCLARYERDDEICLSSERKSALLARLTKVGSGVGRIPYAVAIVSPEDDICRYTPLVYPSKEALMHSERPLTQLHSRVAGFFNLRMIGSPMMAELKRMGTYSNVPAANIDLSDVDIAAFFREGSLNGLPTMGMFPEIIAAAQPRTFSELVQCCGLAEGTGTWWDNAETLLQNGRKPNELIAFREDVMQILMQYGIDRKASFRLAEAVRRGKIHRVGFTEEDLALLHSHDVPDWLIDAMQKIAYLFSKSHGVEFMQKYLRLVWYKLFQPLPFYAVLLTEQLPPDFDVTILSEGKKRMEEEQRALEKRFEEEDEWPWWKAEKVVSKLRVLKLALEVVGKGYSFRPAQEGSADPTAFVPGKGFIRLPRQV